ncbi:hypothetical protein C1646_688152, partial [Rhizophagus diaphanus]
MSNFLLFVCCASRSQLRKRILSSYSFNIFLIYVVYIQFFIKIFAVSIIQFRISIYVLEKLRKFTIYFFYFTLKRSYSINISKNKRICFVIKYVANHFSRV